MDYKQQNYRRSRAGSARRKVSLVERDEFFNKFLSRNPSLGCSSRAEYYRSSEGVPFNWEKQPGTPKHQPIQDTLPPLSPPPALLSLGLPKPCIKFDEPKPPLMTKLKFWKQKRKTHESSKWVKAATAKSDMMMISGHEDDDHKLMMNFYEICSSDGDDHRFAGNNCSSSNSSSSESCSLSVNGNSFKSSSMVGSTHDDDGDDHDHDNDVDDDHSWLNLHGCGPWTSVLVRVIRR